ncbi:MAG: hypothetical protein HUJ88_12950 [Fusobacterium necrophorum]|nr:hypothetical protein [Fusobacterium necrophorum]
MKRKSWQFCLFFLLFVGCTSLEEFNQGLNNFNQKLAGITGETSSSKRGKITPVKLSTNGKGKFENLEIEVVPDNHEDRNNETVYIRGFYTNTSKKRQAFKITFDLIADNGNRLRGEDFGFMYHDIRPGERIDLSESSYPGNKAVPAILSTPYNTKVNIKTLKATYLPFYDYE